MPARVFALALALATLTGCQYLFVNDHRIAIDTPANFATVGEPLTIGWNARGFSAPADGHFLVFIDRDPQPAGQTVAEYFRSYRDGIFQVDATSYRISVLQPHPGVVDPLEANHHDVTVVMVDRQGRRIGEWAGYVEFTVRAPGQAT